MASITKGRVHLEVWDILCLDCCDLFWQEPRDKKRFFTRMCEKCAKTFLDWATEQGETSALHDYHLYRD